MARQLGAPKVGGRVVGTPNKIKMEVRIALADFIKGNFADFKRIWRALPDDNPTKIKTYVDVLKYILPPLQPEDLSVYDNHTAANAIAKSVADVVNASGNSDNQ